MTYQMHWITAIEFARQQNDVSYEEWCELYYDHSDPTVKQIEKACEMAYAILLRNGIIAEDPMAVVFHGFGDGPDAWPRRDDPRPVLYKNMS
jgi:hypothetical protein